MEKIFIYELTDPRTNEPKYIGKTGDLKGRFKLHLKDKAKTYKANWIRSLLKENLQPVLNVIDEVNENEWCFWERWYIELYKSWGFKLTNGTNGGEGLFKPSNEIRKKMSLAKLGKPSLKKGKTLEEMCGVEKAKEIKGQMSLFRFGKTYEEVLGKEKAKEVKVKQQKIRKGKSYEEIFGEEKAGLIKEKQSKAIHPSRPAWNKGIKSSEEVRLKIKESLKDKMTEERKEYLSEKVLITLDKKKKNGFKFYNERSVQQINKTTGEIVKIWNNCQEAERFFNKEKRKDNISDCARQNKFGKNRSCYGYKWLYLN